MKTESLIRKIDQNIVNAIKDAYLNKKTINQSGVEIFQEPFAHGVISDLVPDLEFINELGKETKSKLKYAQKNNDLYKFHQTADLKSVKSKNMQKFRDQILYGSVVKLLSGMTGIELSSDKMDVTSSKYEFTDYLLCHDDDIHDDEKKYGRRIAYIYYMVPPDWSSADGGNLDLFKVNDQLQPIEIVKTIVPKFNSLLFFEVSDRSFHQVAEVVSKSKCRLSINGWFHGEINYRPQPVVDPLPEPSPYLDIDPNLFFEWIIEKYLKPMNQTEIQMKFANSSEIKLEKIFTKKKYQEATEAIGSKNIVWTRKGPANRRNYEVAELETLPEVLKDLVKVLTSDFMGLTLSNMTGLAVHSSVVKSKESENEAEDEDDDDDDDEEEDFQELEDENSESSKNSQEEESEESDDEDDDEDDDDDDENDSVEKKPENNGKRKLSESSSSDEEEEDEDDESKPGTSSSKAQSESLYKKFKSSSNEQTSCENQACTSTSSEEISAIESTGGNDSRENKPKCYAEVRRWKKGSYTLITDNDDQIKTKALDLMVFFGSKLWSLDCGGNISYIARDEDNELLTVNPDENCISLVYRDDETLKFTKYVNSKINDLNEQGCFYEISIVYYEH